MMSTVLNSHRCDPKVHVSGNPHSLILEINPHLALNLFGLEPEQQATLKRYFPRGGRCPGTVLTVTNASPKIRYFVPYNGNQLTIDLTDELTINLFGLSLLQVDKLTGVFPPSSKSQEAA